MHKSNKKETIKLKKTSYYIGANNIIVLLQIWFYYMYFILNWYIFAQINGKKEIKLKKTAVI